MTNLTPAQKRAATIKSKKIATVIEFLREDKYPYNNLYNTFSVLDMKGLLSEAELQTIFPFFQTPRQVFNDRPYNHALDVYLREKNGIKLYRSDIQALKNEPAQLKLIAKSLEDQSEWLDYLFKATKYAVVTTEDQYGNQY
jgi:hypothetical protein